jgi:ABC-type sugar transport system ATPase subunit
MADDRGTLLSVEGLSKAFLGVPALDQVSLRLRAGEILALVGENGAGKSTLIKILTGVYAKDAGRILLNGIEVAPLSPSEAFALGIGVIHQEFHLVPEMSAAENIFLGRLPRRAGALGRLGAIDKARILSRSQEVLDELGGNFSAATPVKNLGVGQQQLVEIAKALAFDARIVIMDEPTATLSSTDVTRLLDTMRRMKARGIGVVFVTHRLEEIFRIADRVVVLRDGRNAGEGEVAELTKERVIAMMVGRSLDQLYPKQPAAIGAVVLAVEHLGRGNLLRDVSFQLRRGEILGFAGLVGARRTELMRALFGADGDVTGRIRVDGKEVTIRGPEDAVRHGLGLVPEDRKLQGLVLNMAIETNISLACLGRLVRMAMFVDRVRERALAQDFQGQLHIKANRLDQEVRFLSGGNQQKVVLAKWLALKPKILILDEPTRGVDVGAKAEIHALVSRFAAQGMGVIMVSSDLPEILGMCDRVLVMSKGSITGEFTRDEASPEKIMACAIPSAAPARSAA